MGTRSGGLSRMYLGAHSPLDVVAETGLGLFIGAALNLVFGVAQHRLRAVIQ